ncbi:Uncharacterised protein [Bordetella pertussis]|nr:Uncharacterised protein [Bordetella pertussis]
MVRTIDACPGPLRCSTRARASSRAAEQRAALGADLGGDGQPRVVAPLDHADGAHRRAQFGGQGQHAQLRAGLPVGAVEQRQQGHAHLLAHQFHQGFDGVEFEELVQAAAQPAHDAVDLAPGALGAVKAQERIGGQHFARVGAGRVGVRQHDQRLFVQGRPARAGHLAAGLDHQGRVQLAGLDLAGQFAGLAGEHAHVQRRMIALQLRNHLGQGAHARHDGAHRDRAGQLARHVARRLQVVV